MKPMLAISIDKMVNSPFPAYLTPKIDGIRAIVCGGKLLSRSLKEIPNKRLHFLGHILPEGVDMEITSGASFQDTTSCVMSHSNQLSSVVVWVFDLCYEAAVEDRLSKLRELTPTIERVNADTTPLGVSIRVLQHKLVFSLEEVYADRKYFTHPFEGVMLRKAGSVYALGRSSTKQGNLIKVKEFSDGEAIIVGFEEELENTNPQKTNLLGTKERSRLKEKLVPKGSLGALIVEDIHTNMSFCIGSGFTETQRHDIWEHKNLWLGKIVKYKHFATCGVKYKPRFPVFVGVRHEDDL